MCPNFTRIRYKTLYGHYWLCYECAIIHGHMLTDRKSTNEEEKDVNKKHGCECEHISHMKS